MNNSVGFKVTGAIISIKEKIKNVTPVSPRGVSPRLFGRSSSNRDMTGNAKTTVTSPRNSLSPRDALSPTNDIKTDKDGIPEL
jgi:hypothetical protein